MPPWNVTPKGETVSLRFEHGLNLPVFTAAMGKAACLGLFADRGYKYILLPMLDHVRKAIREDGGDRRRLAGRNYPRGHHALDRDPQSAGPLHFEGLFPGGVPVCASLVNLGGTFGAASAIFAPASYTNIGNWDGLIRAADVFSGKSNLQIGLPFAYYDCFSCAGRQRPYRVQRSVGRSDLV